MEWVNSVENILKHAETFFYPPVFYTIRVGVRGEGKKKLVIKPHSTCFSVYILANIFIWVYSGQNIWNCDS